jgi:hypothetical protein
VVKVESPGVAKVLDVITEHPGGKRNKITFQLEIVKSGKHRTGKMQTLAASECCARRDVTYHELANTYSLSLLGVPSRQSATCSSLKSDQAAGVTRNQTIASNRKFAGDGEIVTVDSAYTLGHIVSRLHSDSKITLCINDERFKSRPMQGPIDNNNKRRIQYSYELRPPYRLSLLEG